MRHKLFQQEEPIKICPFVPSSFIQKCARFIIPGGVGKIADIACGSGRNLVPFLTLNPQVYAYDIDLGRLEGFKALYPEVHLISHQVDLCSDVFQLPEASFSLVILVHFYTKSLFEKVVQCVTPGGFLLFETIDDRGMNFLEMPEHGVVQALLEKDFVIRQIAAKDIKNTGRQKLKICAQRISITGHDIHLESILP